MRGIILRDSPFLDFGEVKSLGEGFGMGDVKLVDSSRRRATHARSPALSIGRMSQPPSHSLGVGEHFQLSHLSSMTRVHRRGVIHFYYALPSFNL